MERTKKTPPDIPLVIATTLLLATCLVDFDIHQNQGLSVPEIRAYYEQFLGPFVAHIGNFGFAATASIVTTAAYRLIERRDLKPDESSLTKSVLRHGYLGILALALAAVAASELARGNSGVWGDIASSALGLGSGASITSQALHRFHIGRNAAVALRADKLFENNPKPTLLHQVATSADMLFPSA